MILGILQNKNRVTTVEVSTAELPATESVVPASRIEAAPTMCLTAVEALLGGFGASDFLQFGKTSAPATSLGE